MTTTAERLDAHSRANDPAEASAAGTIRLIPVADSSRADGPHRSLVTSPDRSDHGHSPASPGHAQAVRSWPLLVLALPAAVAVWSGWVGIGQPTGFGQVHPPCPRPATPPAPSKSPPTSPARAGSSIR